MDKKNILVFTGAGVSAESGVPTFRNGSNTLWNNYKIEDVATNTAWYKNKKVVLDFYNERRRELVKIEPNLSHKIIYDLEKNFNVSVVTQNVDCLHEKAGSTNIIHLHGELNKSRSSVDDRIIYDCFGDINIGDKCEKGSQIRPHIVWFGEDLDSNILENSYEAAYKANICIIVGTSMKVYPASDIPFKVPLNCIIYYIDPSDIDFYVPKYRRPFFYHIQEKASVGLKKVYNDLIKIYNIN